MIPQRQVEEGGISLKPFNLFSRLKEETLLHDSAFDYQNKGVDAVTSDVKPPPFSKTIGHLDGSLSIQRLRLEEKTRLLQSSNDRNKRKHLSGRKKSVKRVRFETENGASGIEDVKIHLLGPFLKPSSDMTASEKNDVWWQASDYQLFLKDIGEIASEIYHGGTETSSSSYSTTLKRTYQACCSNHRSLVYGDALSPLTRKQLEEWTRLSIPFRGLEFVSIPFLVAARRRSRDDSVVCVVNLAKRLSQKSTHGPNMKAESLREFSQRRTQSARLFAQVMGEADAAAAKDDDFTNSCSRRFTVC